MNRLSREKLLLIALLGIIALWQGQGLFHSLFIRPVQERRERLDGLEQEISQLKDIELEKLKRATKNLKEWEGRSLPPDPVVAVSYYQPWLIELATQSKWTGVSVDNVSGNPQLKGGTYYTITASLKGRATLDRIGDFLHAFHEAGLLHRVMALTIESQSNQGNPPLDVTVSIEALALTKSPSRQSLFVDATKPPKPGRPLKDRKEYEGIVARNLFVSTFKPPKPPAKTEEHPKTTIEALPDTAEFVYLVASVASGEQRDATLLDRTSNKETKLAPGTSFDIAGLSGKVISIHDDHVLVDVKGEQWLLDLGRNLRQMRKP